MLEYLIEQISNKSYEEFCRDNIFNPLNMKNTSFDISDFSENRAKSYLCLGGLLTPIPDLNHFATAAGSMVTSIEDLSHYLIAHMNNGTYDGVRILKNETVELMHTKQYPDDICNLIGYYYGLGWEIYPEDWEWNGMVLQGHAGSMPGGAGEMLWDEASNLGILAFVNRRNSMNNYVELWCYNQIITELLKTIEK